MALQPLLQVVNPPLVYECYLVPRRPVREIEIERERDTHNVNHCFYCIQWSNQSLFSVLVIGLGLKGGVGAGNHTHYLFFYPITSNSSIHQQKESAITRVLLFVVGCDFLKAQSHKLNVHFNVHQINQFKDLIIPLYTRNEKECLIWYGALILIRSVVFP